MHVWWTLDEWNNTECQEGTWSRAAVTKLFSVTAHLIFHDGSQHDVALQWLIVRPWRLLGLQPTLLGSAGFRMAIKSETGSCIRSNWSNQKLHLQSEVTSNCFWNRKEWVVSLPQPRSIPLKHCGTAGSITSGLVQKRSQSSVCQFGKHCSGISFSWQCSGVPSE